MKRYFLILIMFILSIMAFGQNEWTVMIYMAADNDFEAASFNAVDEMEKIGSLYNGYSDIEFVVLWDRAPGYLVTNPDWTGTRIYTIKKDTQVGVINSDYINFYPAEANMGDPETLKNFVRYCDINHNAKNYSLIMWGFGDGWYNERNGSRAVCYDSTSNNDFLTIQELEDAFPVINSILKKNIKILGFDASMMQMVEVMTAVSMGADIMIGSQQVQPGFWPYEKVFQAFIDNYGYPEKISSAIVKAYTQKYEGQTDFNVCLSAVDLSKIYDLVWRIKRFQQYLNTSFVKNFETFKNSVNEACHFNRNENADLYHFLGVFARDVKDKKLDRLAVDVLLAIYDTVIENSITQTNPISSQSAVDISKAHGISVYLPFRRDIYLKESYEKLRFSKDSGWRDILNKFLDYYQTGSSFTISKKIKPTEIKVLKMEKNSSEHIYTDVTFSHFDSGFKYMFGNFPYGQYENEYYQVYVKFDFAQFDAIKDSIVVEDIELNHWSGISWKIKEKKILGKLNTAFSGNYVKSGEYTLINSEMSSLSFKGKGLNELISNYIKETEVNNGIVMGAGIENTISGHVKGFNTDNISLVIKYSYK
ncbi:MAG: clostripain-related cysteine peptidase [Candidatus Muirbacterium halophilum]|nr:clostripain-related cysteine peptidase [Candidatus Muirbacterium halophilum]MCK9475823.1 clostripain-related cysteine peptidase [Candidatus Muirbacterium halophilum]